MIYLVLLISNFVVIVVACKKEVDIKKSTHMKADQRRAVAEMVSDELPEESIYWLIVFFKSVLVVVEI
jgi:protein involved in sex pheromone biosynthesis